MKEKTFNPYMGLPFASITLIGSNGVIDDIDCTTATPKDVMEFCERNLEKLNKKRK